MGSGQINEFISDRNIWFQKNMSIGQVTNDAGNLTEPYLHLLRINKDNQLLLGTADFGASWSGSLWLFQNPSDAPNTARSVAGMELDVGASDAQFLPNGSQIIAADYSSDISLYDVVHAAEDCPMYFSRSASFTGHDSFVTSLDIDFSGNTFVSGSDDSSLMLWDVETQFCKKNFSHAHKNKVTCVAINPEDTALFTSSSIDSTALLWDTRCEKPASILYGGEESITCVDWIDSKTVIIGDDIGSVNVFDMRSKDLLHTHNYDKNRIRRIRCERSSNAIGLAVDDASVHIIQWIRGTLEAVNKCLLSDTIGDITWSKDSRMYYCSWDGQVGSLDMTTN